MPYDMVGADLTGLAKPYVPTVAQNGTRRIKRITKFKDATPDLVEEVTVNVAVPIPPLSGGAIRYSLTSTLTPATDPLVQGAVKRADWWSYFASDAGLNDPDVVKTEWLLDGVLILTDSSGPYQFRQPWTTTDSAAHTLAVRVYLRSDPNPKFFTATMQTETAGPTPGVPLAWPRKDYEFGGFVRTPVTKFLQHTYASGRTKAARVNQFNGTTTEDIRLVAPSDKPLDAMGGIGAKGYRAVVGENFTIDVSRNWAQQWVDDNLGADKFAMGNRTYWDWAKNTAVSPADSESQTCLDFESTQRAFLFDGNKHVYIESIVAQGPGLMEGCDLGGAFDGSSSHIYIQILDIRTPTKWRDGWNPQAGVPGITGHNGGDMLQVWRPVHLHIDDLRFDANWYQGMILKAVDQSFNGFTDGVSTVEVRHMLARSVQGYNNGGLMVHFTDRDVSPTQHLHHNMDITMNNECYAYLGRMGGGSVIRSTWPRTVGGATVPTGKYRRSAGDDMYALPATQSFGTSGTHTLTSIIGGSFGNPSVGVDANGDHFAYYPSAPGNTYLHLKIYNAAEKAPDLATWPGGIENSLGGFANGWAKAGMGT